MNANVRQQTPTARDLAAAKRSQVPATTLNQLKASAPAVDPTRAAPKTPAVFVPAAEYRMRYLDEIAPSGVVGRMIKFSKDGTFITPDDDQVVPPETEFVALCDQTLVGWLKFNGPGEPPDRSMGLLYENFIMPPIGTMRMPMPVATIRVLGVLAAFLATASAAQEQSGAVKGIFEKYNHAAGRPRHFVLRGGGIRSGGERGRGGGEAWCAVTLTKSHPCW